MAGALNGVVEDFKLPVGGAAGRRRLAGLLAKAGEELCAVHGIELTKQEALSHMMWEMLLNGEISFPDGRLIFIEDADQWLSIAKFVYSHLDGPAVTVADSRATNAVVRVVFGDEDPYPDGTPQVG